MRRRRPPLLWRRISRHHDRLRIQGQSILALRANKKRCPRCAFCCLESHESDGHGFLAWQPRLREAGRRRTERAVCPLPRLWSRADTISWPYPACCVAADLSSCTTATRPSAPDTSCLSAAAARGALRWQLGPRRDCRLRACRCGVLLARGGAQQLASCTEAGVGELKRATAAGSSPAAPCCWQL